MRFVLERIISILCGLGAGTVVGTAVVSFISMIGIIPRFLSEGKIRSHYLAAGSAATLGITIGTLLYIWKPYIPIPKGVVAVFALAFGMFVGCLAVALAEVLDVLPIMQRRLKLKKGLHLIIIALSIGKLIGSLCYWLYPGFLARILQ